MFCKGGGQNCQLGSRLTQNGGCPCTTRVGDLLSGSGHGAARRPRDAGKPVYTPRPSLTPRPPPPPGGCTLPSVPLMHKAPPAVGGSLVWLCNCSHAGDYMTAPSPRVGCCLPRLPGPEEEGPAPIHCPPGTSTPDSRTIPTRDIPPPPRL